VSNEYGRLDTDHFYPDWFVNNGWCNCCLPLADYQTGAILAKLQEDGTAVF